MMQDVSNSFHALLVVIVPDRPFRTKEHDQDLSKRHIVTESRPLHYTQEDTILGARNALTYVARCLEIVARLEFVPLATRSDSF